MPAYFSARLTYANGIAAQGVEVRVFDRDEPGHTDDDLTLSPGLTDSLGRFQVVYDPARAQDHQLVTRTVPANPPFDWTPVQRTFLEPDPGDDFQPYLRFTYTIAGKKNTGSAPLKPRQTVFQLPEVLEKPFLPTLHGFHFVNRFSGLFLPFSLPFFPDLGNPSATYGLCGGMSAAALDFFLINRAIPQTSEVPVSGAPLQRYLYKRQLDSFGRLGEVILRFIEWMGLPPDSPQGLFKRTLEEFEKIRTRLNRFNPVPLGLVYVLWKESREVWQNHQVLATGYTRDSQNRLQIRIYDPNYPLRDDVRIEAERVPVGQGQFGLICRQWIGDSPKTLHGFFAMPYQPVIPPEDLSQ
ncbi:MAG TPA: hypothetical protein DEQ80_09610 [Anaerolinea thermolimosa]|uniref:Peptidase C39-like domain-containing protein n=2 Tax=Anaerolinea thermolimosa TaxID=229919 RepID=A0A3D1JHZ3_9CHLR|nr:hypothetical protein [Anaerolinea thermolimosa]